MAGEFVSYLESNGLSCRQFGFRKCLSIEDRMLLVYSEIANLVDDGLVIDMILLDFSKAMWCVIVVLLDKLDNQYFAAQLDLEVSF